MGHSYKGSAVPFKTIGTGQPPYLTGAQSDTIVWYYQGTLPQEWGFYYASDIVLGHELDIQPGTTTANAGIGSFGDRIVIRGRNSLGTLFTTPTSNIFVIP